MKAHSIVTVVLAAGAGARMGGPKALLLWPTGRPPAPRPLAIAHAEERLAAETDQVMIVLRKDVLRVLLASFRPGVDLLVSSAVDELGPAGSLAVAASRLPDARIVIVTPVDTPPARADTVQQLVARLDADPALLAVSPSCHGRAGHPVALRPSALDRYRAKNPPTLRDHLRSLGDRAAFELVSDPTVLVDLDTPAAVQGLLGSAPRFATG